MVSLVDVVSPCFPGDHAPPQARDGHDGHHVDQVHGRQTGEDDQPEPEGHIDLLVDDVEAKNAEGILLVHGSWERGMLEGKK